MGLQVTAWKNPATSGDDASVGANAWANQTNNQASDNVYASVSINSVSNVNVVDNSVKAIRNGSIAGTEHALAGNWPGSDPNSYLSYGGQGDLWGLANLLASEVNASNWGWGLSAKSATTGNTSHYLTATNHTMSVPVTATPVGIEARVERYAGGGITCLVSGTPLTLPAGGRVPIEQIKPGDRIIGFDPVTLKPGIDLVTYVGARLAFVHYLISAGGRKIAATSTHSFLTGVNEFKPVSQLRVGETIYCLCAGLLIPVRIEHIERRVIDTVVYDLSTKKYHTYFAGDFAVHNIAIGSTSAFVDHMQMRIWYRQPGVIIKSDGMMLG
jgi:hypothetical protein